METRKAQAQHIMDMKSTSKIVETLYDPLESLSLQKEVPLATPKPEEKEKST